MPGHVGTCPGRGRCRQAPETGRQPSRPIRSRHEALGHQPPLSPRFLPYMGGPAWAIKPFPTLTDFADSLYPADSLCFADPPRSLAYPPPGVLPESDCPIKGPDQWSIGVAPSSRGVSYTHPKGGSDMWKQGATLIGSQVHYFMCTEPAPCLGQVLVYRRIKTLAK